MKLKHIVVMAVIALALGGATWKLLPVIDYFSSKTIHWRQEAPLHDGRMLVVDRISKLGPSDPFGQSTRMEIEQALSFRHPDTGEKIGWTIPDGLWPIMIDFENGTPWFLLRTAMASDYSKWGCPNPPWLAYRYQDGKWRLASFETFPVSLAWLNLIPISKSVPEKGGLLLDRSYVTAGRVEGFWAEILWRENPGRKRGATGLEARSLSREKIAPAKLAYDCGLAVIIAMGRESEVDKKSREKIKRDQEHVVSEDVRRDGRQRMDMLKKELKERLQ